MRIAYLSTFYPFRGGIAQFNAALYRALEAQGHEVQAFTFSRQYPDFLFPGSSQYVTEKDNADEIGSEELLDTIHPISYFSTAKKIRAYRPDVLFMGYWMSFFGPSLGTVARKMLPQTKVVSVLHNVIPHEPKIIDCFLTPYFLQPHNGFVVMSEQVKKDLLTLRPNANVLLKPHPLYRHFGEKIEREKACKQLSISPEKKIILFFGFIRDYKGLDILIDAFAQLDSSYQLVIAGEVYGSFEKYEKQIEQHPLKTNIAVFNQYISDREVPCYFSAADVCVLPYRSATQSGITSIAQHFEVPLIATDVGGLKESIRPEISGKIIEKPGADLLAKALKEYFETDQKTAFQKELHALKEELSWEKFAEAFTTFCEKL